MKAFGQGTFSCFCEELQVKLIARNFKDDSLWWMFHGPLLTLLVAFIPVGSAQTVDSYTELQRHIQLIGPLLLEESADTQWEIKDAQLESGVDFFPDDGSVSSSRRLEDIQGSDKFVVFRLLGVPYLLKDVSLQQWFAPYVRDMAERGIVSGYRDSTGVPTGMFGPERSVTMEELAKMALEASHLDKSVCPITARNPLAKDRWSAEYLSCAEYYSFAAYSDGTVDPSRPATRAEVVMTVLQSFGVQLQDMTAQDVIFTDVSPATIFASAIKTAAAAGIVSGFIDERGNSTGLFGPEKTVNRAEVSKILSLALQIYSK